MCDEDDDIDRRCMIQGVWRHGFGVWCSGSMKTWGKGFREYEDMGLGCRVQGV